MVVVRLLSYWEGNFSGAMLNFGGAMVIYHGKIRRRITNKNQIQGLVLQQKTALLTIRSLYVVCELVNLFLTNQFALVMAQHNSNLLDSHLNKHIPNPSATEKYTLGVGPIDPAIMASENLLDTWLRFYF